MAPLMLSTTTCPGVTASLASSSNGQATSSKSRMRRRFIRHTLPDNRPGEEPGPGSRESAARARLIAQDKFQNLKAVIGFLQARAPHGRAVRADHECANGRRGFGEALAGVVGNARNIEDGFEQRQGHFRGLLPDIKTL